MLRIIGWIASMAVLAVIVITIVDIGRSLSYCK
jgi:hypothetical protein